MLYVGIPKYSYDVMMKNQSVDKSEPPAPDCILRRVCVQLIRTKGHMEGYRYKDFSHLHD